MAFKLSSGLVDLPKGERRCHTQKEETHRMAEANRAFAFYLSFASLRWKFDFPRMYPNFWPNSSR
ncbi:hypothetical protein H5410_063963 [Solanum commersonii]|uniref:Uncharacterized protein n=1 Tax=Solanum commersonii TaxID=4109 RepID=A0A9J5W0J2_SOLCO|nr:hypothetical protein H5410_063963 [Solanum commersonii]